MLCSFKSDIVLSMVIIHKRKGAKDLKLNLCNVTYYHESGYCENTIHISYIFSSCSMKKLTLGIFKVL